MSYNTISLSDVVVKSNEFGGQTITIANNTPNADPDNVLRVFNGRAKAMLYMVTDALFLGKYQHPLTTIDLHFNAGADLDAPAHDNAGVVKHSYEPRDDDPILIIPHTRTKKNQNDPWQQINLDDGDAWLSRFREEKIAGQPQGAIGNRIRRHAFFNNWLKGASIVITIKQSSMKLFEQQLAVWAETEENGIEAGIAKRDFHINSARTTKRMNNEAFQASKATSSNGNEVEAEEPAGPLALKKFGQRGKVQFSKIELGTQYQLAQKDAERPMPAIRTFRGSAQEEHLFVDAASKGMSIHFPNK